MNINEFVTWQSLATLSGALFMTTLLTQTFKGLIDRLIKIPTRVVSYFFAVTVLILATVFMGEVTASSIFLCLFNAAVVSTSANGFYDMAHKTKTPQKNDTPAG